MHFSKSRNKDQRTLKKQVKNYGKYRAPWASVLLEPQWFLTCFLISFHNLRKIGHRDFLLTVQMEKISSEMVKSDLELGARTGQENMFTSRLELRLGKKGALKLAEFPQCPPPRHLLFFIILFWNLLFSFSFKLEAVLGNPN